MEFLNAIHFVACALCENYSTIILTSDTIVHCYCDVICRYSLCHFTIFIVVVLR